MMMMKIVNKTLLMYASSEAAVQGTGASERVSPSTRVLPPESQQSTTEDKLQSWPGQQLDKENYEWH